MTVPQPTTSAKDPLAYLPGDAIGARYRVTGMLGRGGTGAVYAAQHLGTGHTVAIKVLAGVAAGGAAQRFEREARITAGLQHVSTVRVFDLGRDGEAGPLFLVMEWLRGPDLEQVLRQVAEAGRTLTELEAVDLAIQVLGSLTEAHAASLVHRDLKPANVMLTRTGADAALAKVLDFGCAQVGETPGEATPVGTPAYMSPEQCRSEPADARADLYAVAVILYRCVTGRLPFADASPLALMYQHSHAMPPDPDAVAPRALAPSLRELLLRGLAKRAEDRPANAAHMRRDLEAIRAGLDGAAARRPEQVLSDLMAVVLAGGDPAPAPIASQRADPQGRRAARRPVVAAVLALGLGLAGLSWWQQRPIAVAPAVAPVHGQDAPAIAQVALASPDLGAQARALAQAARDSDPVQALRMLTLAVALAPDADLQAQLAALQTKLAPTGTLAEPATATGRKATRARPSRPHADAATVDLQPRLME